MTPFDRRPLDPEELFDPGEERSAAEWEAIDEMTRALDGLRRDDPPPSPDFPDRVMAAIAEEPAPAPLVAVVAALREGRPGRALAAVADAWRTVLGGGRPLVVRAQAAGVLLAALLLAGSVGGGLAVGAARLFGLDAGPVVGPAPTETLRPSPSPSPSAMPSPSPGATEPGQTPEPSETPEASATPRPSETPKATGTQEPSETPEATGTAEPSRTPRPSPTPKPTSTPEPTPTAGDTPEPSETPEGEEHD